MTITARGIGLLTGAALLLVTGLWFGYAELALLGTASAVAVSSAAGYAAWRPRLEVTRLVDPDRVGRGEPATMTLTVRNRGRLRTTSVVAEDRCGRQRVPVPLLRLRPGRDTTVSYPVPTRRRGVVPVGPLRVTGRDALRLVRLARTYGGTTRVWVHPRSHPLTAVPAGVTRSLDGRIDRVPQGSITFDSLREYVIGDELRRVHWRTSARVGELMVREQLDTSLPRLVLLLDNRTTAYPKPVDGEVETFESACEAAASLLVAAGREDLTVVLLLVVEPHSEDAYPDGADVPRGDLDRLAAAELSTGPGGSRTDALPTVVSRLRQQRLGDTLVFLTGPRAAEDLGPISTLRGAYPSVVVGVFGGSGPIPAGAEMVVIDAADGAGFAAEWDRVGRW